MRLADELAEKARDVSCGVLRVSGARVIDAGVEHLGSITAGLMVAQICMADLATVTAVPGAVRDVPLPQIVVDARHPVTACMASQYAGWQVSAGDYFAMGSGPMRAAWGKEDLFDDIGHREKPSCAVGVLESGKLPDGQVVDELARCCRVSPDRLTLLVARTASMVGGVQIVARSVETALHKLHELGFDLTRILAGFGSAPLPPAAKDDLAGIGRTNDAMLYGANCTLYVRGDDDSIRSVAQTLPSCASKDYGQPFAEIFKRYDHNFYKIDPMLFSPARVALQNIETGKTHAVGRINHDVLAESFFT